MDSILQFVVENKGLVAVLMGGGFLPAFAALGSSLFTYQPFQKLLRGGIIVLLSPLRGASLVVQKFFEGLGMAWSALLTKRLGAAGEKMEHSLQQLIEQCFMQPVNTILGEPWEKFLRWQFVGPLMKGFDADDGTTNEINQDIGTALKQEAERAVLEIAKTKAALPNSESKIAEIVEDAVKLVTTRAAKLAAKAGKAGVEAAVKYAIKRIGHLF